MKNEAVKQPSLSRRSSTASTTLMFFFSIFVVNTFINQSNAYQITSISTSTSTNNNMILSSSSRKLASSTLFSSIKYHHHHQQQQTRRSSALLSRHLPFYRSQQSYLLCNSESSCCSNNNNNNNNNEQNDIAATIDDAYKNSNEYLVQARIQARVEKRQTRKDSQEEKRQRNLRIKRLIHNDARANNGNGSNDNDSSTSSAGFQIPKLYALRLSVDKELRDDLKLNGREKRGRVFIEEGNVGCSTMKGLKYEIHAFFRALKKSTYILSAGMPEILDDGSIFSPGAEDDDDDNDSSSNGKEDENNPYKEYMPIESDDDVSRIFEMAQEYYENHNSNLSEDASNRLKRPSLLLHVRKDPNAPVPPPPPSYLVDIADPKKTDTMTMLSFYSFPENGIQDPEEFGIFLRKIWKPFGSLGRVYVAKEGVNAQMSIPTNV